VVAASWAAAGGGEEGGVTCDSVGDRYSYQGRLAKVPSLRAVII
jgi:hypothetical protein